MNKIMVVLISLTLVACSNEKQNEINITQYGQIAMQYVESYSYDVLSLDEEIMTSFTEENLSLLVHKQFWAVQKNEPTEVLNKQLTKVSLTVTNHLLDDQYKVGKTKVFIYLDSDQVIASASYPISKQPTVGAVYSIDGRTAEEVKSNYLEWSRQWDDKYNRK